MNIKSSEESTRSGWKIKSSEEKEAEVKWATKKLDGYIKVGEGGRERDKHAVIMTHLTRNGTAKDVGYF